MNMNTPDWTLWRYMPEVTLWEACALSLNIEPTSLQPDPYASLAGHGGRRIFLPESFPDDATRNDYYQRLRVLREWRNNPLFTPCAGNFGLPDDNSKVRSFEFVPWAQGMNWDIPEELVSLGYSVSPLPFPSAPQAVKNEHISNDRPGKRRTNLLTAVIDGARKVATEPDDTNSVWASLVKIAQSNDRLAPLLGYVEGEGVKYQGENDVEFLTLKNFRDRMWRARRDSQ